MNKASPGYQRTVKGFDNRTQRTGGGASRDHAIERTDLITAQPIDPALPIKGNVVRKAVDTFTAASEYARLQSPSAATNGKWRLRIGGEQRDFDTRVFVEELTKLEEQGWKLRSEHLGGIFPKVPGPGLSWTEMVYERVFTIRSIPDVTG